MSDLTLNDIETENLILRTAVKEDAQVVNRELAKWDIAKMLALVPHPFPEMSNEEWWENMSERAFPSEGLWRMLVLKGDPARTSIGNVSCRPREGNWQMGYWLAEEHWGKGLMSEAVEAALAHVLGIWSPDKIISGVFIDNPASRRILEKAGMTYTNTTDEWCEARQENVPHWNFEVTAVN